MQRRILYVEDDIVDQMAFRRLVKSDGLPWEVLIADSVSDARRMLAGNRYDLVLTDYLLGDGTAFDVIDLARDMPVIFTTGTGNEEIAVKAMKAGAYDYLIKDPERNYLKVLPVTIENTIRRREAEQRSRMLSHTITSINDSVFIADLQNRIIFVNRSFCDTYGYTEEEVMGMHTSMLWAEAAVSTDGRLDLLALAENANKGEYEHRRSDGTVFPVSLSWSIIRDENNREVAIVGVARDVTERRRSEEALRESEERYRAIVEDQTEMICRFLLDGTITFVNAAFCRYYQRQRRDLIGYRFVPYLPEDVNPADSDVIRQLSAEQPTAVVETTTTGPDGRTHWQQWTLRRLHDEHGHTVEYQAVGRDVTSDREAEEARRQARDQEVAIGARIQKTLLLGRPPSDISGAGMAAMTIPSQEIDGDFYDFTRFGQDIFDVVVGDVMGKGVPAALVGAAAKSLFPRAIGQLLAQSKCGEIPEPDRIVQMVHNELTQQLIHLDSFVTVCYARFNLREQTLCFVDCGHTKTVVYRAETGACEDIGGDNLPLGFLANELYTQQKTPAKSGDIFVFYSDGVTESANAAGELYGIERLKQLVANNADKTADEILQVIRADTLAFSGSDTSNDDFTVIAVKIGQPAEEPIIVETLEVSSSLGELRRIREFIESFSAHDPDVAAIIDILTLVLDEAAANVMKHAYQGEEDREINLRVSLYSDRIVMELWHMGASFDPSVIPPPSFDGTRDSGFGLFIMNELMDEVSYPDRGDGWKGTRLVKHLHRELGG